MGKTDEEGNPPDKNLLTKGEGKEKRENRRGREAKVYPLKLHIEERTEKIYWDKKVLRQNNV